MDQLVWVFDDLAQIFAFIDHYLFVQRFYFKSIVIKIKYVLEESSGTSNFKDLEVIIWFRIS